GDGLIPDLTLNENILMDFSPDSLTAAKEFQFQEFLKEGPNRDLEKLYQMIPLPHEHPISADAQMKKVSTLIKSLIFEGQFIFLEEPEKDLDSDMLALFISALKDNIARNKQNVFIFSHDVQLWMPHAHHHVKREKDFSFSCQKINPDWQWKIERKEFFDPTKYSTAKKTELTFHLPKNRVLKLPAKKSAA
ncbi:MAG: hypothetical protein ACXVCE_13140, partial [Bacteriovorax sp.]